MPFGARPSSPASSTGSLTSSVASTVEVSESFKVYARLRPQAASKPTSRKFVKPGPPAALEVVRRFGVQRCLQAKGLEFSLDAVWNVDQCQEEVYEDGIRERVEWVVKGHFATVLAYGQTGSGKTHTMFGPASVADDFVRSDPAEHGIVPRACRQLFEGAAARRTAEVSYVVQLSFIEVYADKVRDMLPARRERGDEAGLVLRETPQGLVVEGLTHEAVTTPAEVLRLIQRASTNRVVAAMKMNARSSRGHGIITLTLHAVDAASGLRVSAAEGGKLTLCDLAGMETAKKSQAVDVSGTPSNDPQRREEARHINQSLWALGTVIERLNSGGGGGSAGAGAGDRHGGHGGGAPHVHIPYRDSKLTRLLQESLGGRGAKSAFVATLRTEEENLDESIGSLRFALRVKAVRVVVRARPETAEVRLQRELREAREREDATAYALDTQRLAVRQLKAEIARRDDAASGAEAARLEAAEGGEGGEASRVAELEAEVERLEQRNGQLERLAEAEAAAAHAEAGLLRGAARNAEAQLAEARAQLGAAQAEAQSGERRHRELLEATHARHAAEAQQAAQQHEQAAGAVQRAAEEALAAEEGARRAAVAAAADEAARLRQRLQHSEAERARTAQQAADAADAAAAAQATAAASHEAALAAQARAAAAKMARVAEAAELAQRQAEAAAASAAARAAEQAAAREEEGRAAAAQQQAAHEAALRARDEAHAQATKQLHAEARAAAEAAAAKAATAIAAKEEEHRAAMAAFSAEGDESEEALEAMAARHEQALTAARVEAAAAADLAKDKVAAAEAKRAAEAASTTERAARAEAAAAAAAKLAAELETRLAAAEVAAKEDAAEAARLVAEARAATAAEAVAREEAESAAAAAAAAAEAGTAAATAAARATREQHAAATGALQQRCEALEASLAAAQQQAQQVRREQAALEARHAEAVRAELARAQHEARQEAQRAVDKARREAEEAASAAEQEEAASAAEQQHAASLAAVRQRHHAALLGSPPSPSPPPPPPLTPLPPTTPPLRRQPQSAPAGIIAAAGASSSLVSRRQRYVHFNELVMARKLALASRGLELSGAATVDEIFDEAEDKDLPIEAWHGLIKTRLPTPRGGSHRRSRVLSSELIAAPPNAPSAPATSPPTAASPTPPTDDELDELEADVQSRERDLATAASLVLPVRTSPAAATLPRPTPRRSVASSPSSKQLGDGVRVKPVVGARGGRSGPPPDVASRSTWVVTRVRFVGVALLVAAVSIAVHTARQQLDVPPLEGELVMAHATDDEQGPPCSWSWTRGCVDAADQGGCVWRPQLGQPFRCRLRQCLE